MPSPRVDIRIPDDLLSALEEISQRKGYRRRTTVIIEALERYVEEELKGLSPDSINIKIERYLLERVGPLMEMRGDLDIRDVISDALEVWCEEHERYFTEVRDRVARLRDERRVQAKGQRRWGK